MNTVYRCSNAKCAKYDSIAKFPNIGLRLKSSLRLKKIEIIKKFFKFFGLKLDLNPGPI